MEQVKLKFQEFFIIGITPGSKVTKTMQPENLYLHVSQ